MIQQKMMKATSKNLLMLTRFEERMQSRNDMECFQGHTVLTAYDLWPGERYHAERLVQLGFLKKTTSHAPWNGSQPVTMYYIDAACQENPFPYQGMQNKRMQEMLAGGEAIDLSGCPRSGGGEYLLGQVDPRDLVRAGTDHEALRLAECNTLFEDGKDYCDAQAERWIWSIGIHRETGLVWASTTSNQYRCPGIVCIWLR